MKILLTGTIGGRTKGFSPVGAVPSPRLTTAQSDSVIRDFALRYRQTAPGVPVLTVISAEPPLLPMKKKLTKYVRWTLIPLNSGLVFTWIIDQTASTTMMS